MLLKLEVPVCAVEACRPVLLKLDEPVFLKLDEPVLLKLDEPVLLKREDPVCAIESCRACAVEVSIACALEVPVLMQESTSLSTCPDCSQTFNRVYDMRRHRESVHLGKRHKKSKSKDLCSQNWLLFGYFYALLCVHMYV